jgi:hypothetical protein
VTSMPKPQLPIYKSEDVGGAATWSTSSFSGGGNCVEVRRGVNHVLVRHSRNPNGPTLRFTLAEWDSFLAGARQGEFDLG